MSKQKGFLMYFAEMIEQYRTDRQYSLPRGIQSQPSRLRRFLRWLTPNGGTLLLVAALIVTTQVWAKPLTSPVNAPGSSVTTVNYQGRLADSGGTPLDGTYGMSFSLWDADTGGSLIWGPESHAAVPVSDGLFNVGLGSESGGIPTNVWDGYRYLEITVGGEALSPRELIRSVPIAGMALTVPDGSITSDKLDFRVPQLLGHKTCGEENEPTESGLVPGWHSVRGINNQDTIEVTVTTHGGPVMAYMTARYRTDPPGDHWCSINVYQGETYIRRAMLDGDDPSPDSQAYGCSGGYLFTDLSAGTYTFRAMAFVRPAADVQWERQRQIVVFEYEN